MMTVGRIAFLVFIDAFLTCSAYQTQVPPTTAPDVSTLGSLTVSSVGIGTISWTSDSFIRPHNPKLASLVSTACRDGGAPVLLDTAERYGSHWRTAIGLGWGETESLVGKIREQQKRDTVQAATKFTPTPWRTTVDSVVEACQESQRRLGDDSPIPLYQLHMPDIVQPFGQKPKDHIYWKGLAKCYQLGLVENVGVCNYGPTLLRECQLSLAAEGVPLASNQIAYSLLGRHDGAQETVDACRDMGIQTLAFFPFAMGLLTGKYNPTTGSSTSKKSVSSMSSSLVASKKTSFEQRDLQRYASQLAPLLHVLQGIADAHEKSLSQVALNYVICKGAIPLPGARTTEQVADNMGALGWRLEDREVRLLENEADRLGFGFDGAGFKRTSEKFVGYGMERWALD